MKTPGPMRLLATILTTALVVAFTNVEAQTTEKLQAEVEMWKKEAKAAQARAEKAEMEAIRQQNLALAAQRMAEENAEIARKAERSANRLRYLSQAKVMALRTKELGNEPVLEALVALQAYKFHSEYEGNPTDKDIYNGLFTALTLFKDPMTTKTGVLDLYEMSESACKYVKRNMTREEWDNFVGSDLWYQRTCENYPANNK